MTERPRDTASTSPRYDVAVVGAGPAGLAAAVAAAEAGRRVVLVDAGGQPGGQYWRHPDETAPRGDESLGHHDWSTFTALRSRLHGLVRRRRITHLPWRQVWFVERPSVGDEPPAHTLHLTTSYAGADTGGEGPDAVTGDAVILCPGGYDRQLPIPGWDLPGVMAAGGVQALLKGHRTVAGRRAIVAGTGPFLLPVATGLAQAGADVVAVCEAGSITGWSRDPLAAAAVPGKAREALEYATELIRHRIPYRQRTAITAIRGTEAVRSVELSRLDREGRIREDAGTADVDLVALGWGFTPSLELVSATGAATRKDIDDSLVAVVDDEQRATVPGVYVAGEATGVGGAMLAVAEGELAGLMTARDQRAPVSQGNVRTLQKRITRHRRFAAAMHAAHPVPRHWHEWLSPETTVCRCEEVSYRQVCGARDELGAGDARTVKLMARPGMGWCQGRVCGFASAKLAAATEGRALTADDLRPTAKQPFTAPVSLEQLAESPRYE
ncbi:FAD-dependent oxidoreductase [Prauserella alba]|uniref:FAD-dependent oxidoreductase n=2 Tax=Prauserella alba TaxID=176898 RepID=UPI0020A2ED7C|nr:FAD-dependent oxidoreductase [Prauserella alba]MCP2181303.1 Pyruvate/2-oxoglutarate dehydrogenase complex, dihydrolipoamide dehydrogenase (E3) component [Prauserella alba]